jgi:NADH dehydrogenase/NADH:ubiquinone oxidoreductase subunit G
LLQKSPAPVILLGPAILAHAGNPALLQAAQRLVDNLAARVIALPEEANLAGALRLGVISEEASAKNPQVLYLVGEALPVFTAERPFILYQNLYPPPGDDPADLLLPMAAFTEVRGTLIDCAGRVRAIQPAVPPPGLARPAWKVICEIARRMGAQEFDYTGVEDIWRAAQAEFPGFPDVQPGAALPALVSSPQPGLPCEHNYLGFPLSVWVGGLRDLYPDSVNGGRHE